MTMIDYNNICAVESMAGNALINKTQQVVILVSKLRAAAKNSSKNCQNEPKQLYGLLSLEENSRFARVSILFYEGNGEME